MHPWSQTLRPKSTRPLLTECRLELEEQHEAISTFLDSHKIYSSSFSPPQTTWVFNKAAKCFWSERHSLLVVTLMLFGTKDSHVIGSRCETCCSQLCPYCFLNTLVNVHITKSFPCYALLDIIKPLVCTTFIWDKCIFSPYPSNINWPRAAAVQHHWSAQFHSLYPINHIWNKPALVTVICICFKVSYTKIDQYFSKF